MWKACEISQLMICWDPSCGAIWVDGFRCEKLVKSYMMTMCNILDGYIFHHSSGNSAWEYLSEATSASSSFYCLLMVGGGLAFLLYEGWLRMTMKTRTRNRTD